MDWEVFGPMMVAVVLIVTSGGVLVLRPITKRLSEVLELYARERQAGLQQEVSQIRDLLETVSARLELIEDRQDFTERLIGSGEKGGRERPDRPGEARRDTPA